MIRLQTHALGFAALLEERVSADDAEAFYHQFLDEMSGMERPMALILDLRDLADLEPEALLKVEETIGEAACPAFERLAVLARNTAHERGFAAMADRLRFEGRRYLYLIPAETPDWEQVLERWHRGPQA